MYQKLHPDGGTCERFKAGTGWLKRFRDHHGVHSLHTQGESLSADSSSVALFRGQFLKIVVDESLTRDQEFSWMKLPNGCMVKLILVAKC